MRIKEDKRYKNNLVEKKWQGKWLKDEIYSPDIKKSKKPFYNLWMFPYPSGAGIHAGHAFSSTGSDVYGRFMRMRGHDVFQPIGYDSFGIHSENFAIKIKKHPKSLITKTTKTYEKQFKSLGNGYDWKRTVTTSNPEYYKWTQWIFLKMFKSGLAYRKTSSVNWCPSCKTVLADEQVMTPAQAGKIPPGYKSIKEVPEGIKVCERCGNIAEIKDLKQWHFRITNYADELLKGLKKINWPEKVKIAQKNWIGKKQGIDIQYSIEGRKEKITCWTSRPDTNFGATFIVLAPEHPLAEKITTKDNKQKVSKYIEVSKKKSREERIIQGKEKTGVFTGSYATNQLNSQKMPIWISDFVLMEVGTGAVVGVPGHDRRDFEFAIKHKLPIIRVVVGPDGDKSEIKRVNQVQEEEGTMINSRFLNGLDIHKATKKIMDYMVKKGWGTRKVNLHLRDWIISRQRYWGPPIPMIYCSECAEAGESYFTNRNDNNGILCKNQSDWDHRGWFPWPEERLPIKLPFLRDYQPKGTGKGPLADHPEYYETICPSCKGKAVLETDVSDTFLDSSWYFLRYPSVDSKTASKLAFDTIITTKWLPVNLYFGGAEHSVLHLMYARFVTMVLNDLGYIKFKEPFPHFFAHGLMIKDGAKMSKSRGNVVNPDEYIRKHGADTLRLYLMFMGPMDGYPDFRDTGIEGMRRFVDRVWDLFINHTKVIITDKKRSKDISRVMHQTIKKVTSDLENFRYNTAIAAIMEFVNILREQALNNRKDSPTTKQQISCTEWDEVLKTLAQLLAPFAPFITEEVWNSVLNKKYSIHNSKWPSYNQKLTYSMDVTVPVQVNGRLRGTLTVAAESANDKNTIIELAKKQDNVKKWLKNKNIKDIIFIQSKLINFVTTNK